MQLDGNLNIQLLLLELENFSGNKDILFMLPFNKLKLRCTQIYNFMHGHMKMYQLFLLLRELKHNQKDSQVDLEHQLYRLGFTKMEGLFKLLLAIIQAKTLPKCLVFNSRIKKNKKNSLGKQVGVSQQDLLVLW